MNKRFLNYLFLILILVLSVAKVKAQSSTSVNCLYNNDVVLEMQSIGNISQPRMHIALDCAVSEVVEMDTVKIKISATDSCGVVQSMFRVSLDPHINEAFGFVDITIDNTITFEDISINRGIIRSQTIVPNINCIKKYQLQFDVHQIDTSNNFLQIFEHDLEVAY